MGFSILFGEQIHYKAIEFEIIVGLIYRCMSMISP